MKNSCTREEFDAALAELKSATESLSAELGETLDDDESSLCLATISKMASEIAWGNKPQQEYLGNHLGQVVSVKLPGATERTKMVMWPWEDLDHLDAVLGDPCEYVRQTVQWIRSKLMLESISDNDPVYGFRGTWARTVASTAAYPGPAVPGFPTNARTMP